MYIKFNFTILIVKRYSKEHNLKSYSKYLYNSLLVSRPKIYSIKDFLN